MGEEGNVAAVLPPLLLVLESHGLPWKMMESKVAKSLWDSFFLAMVDRRVLG
jgi:hypothetical protein